MLEIFAGGLVVLKSSIIGLFVGMKTYTGAIYLLTKPAIIYGTMRFTWLISLATVEWWSARLYSINCIGEGVGGFYNHLFQIASPACTGLLTTHIGLMGILVASFIITCIWSIYSFVEYIKKTTPANSMLNEYNNVHNMIYRNSSDRNSSDRNSQDRNSQDRNSSYNTTTQNYTGENSSRGNIRSRSRSPPKQRFNSYTDYYQ